VQDFHFKNSRDGKNLFIPPFSRAEIVEAINLWREDIFTRCGAASSQAQCRGTFRGMVRYPVDWDLGALKRPRVKLGPVVVQFGFIRNNVC
jgi:hypothetical protein